VVSKWVRLMSLGGVGINVSIDTFRHIYIYIYIICILGCVIFIFTDIGMRD
jgi:hypothetical protein